MGDVVQLHGDKKDQSPQPALGERITKMLALLPESLAPADMILDEVRRRYFWAYFAASDFPGPEVEHKSVTAITALLSGLTFREVQCCLHAARCTLWGRKFGVPDTDHRLEPHEVLCFLEWPPRAAP